MVTYLLGPSFLICKVVTIVDTQQPAIGNRLEKPEMPCKHRVFSSVAAHDMHSEGVSITRKGIGQNGVGCAAVTNSPPALVTYRKVSKQFLKGSGSQ